MLASPAWELEWSIFHYGHTVSGLHGILRYFQSEWTRRSLRINSCTCGCATERERIYCPRRNTVRRRHSCYNCEISNLSHASPRRIPIFFGQRCEHFHSTKLINIYGRLIKDFVECMKQKIKQMNEKSIEEETTQEYQLSQHW